MDLSAALTALEGNDRAVTRAQLEQLARAAGLEAVVLQHDDALKSTLVAALRAHVTVPAPNDAAPPADPSPAPVAAPTPAPVVPPPTFSASPPAERVVIDVPSTEAPAHVFSGLPEGVPVLTPAAQPATPTGEAAPPPLPPAPASEIVPLPPHVPRGAGPEALRGVSTAPPLSVGGVPVLSPDRPALPTGSAGMSIPVLRPASAEAPRVGGVPVLTPDGGDALTVAKAVLRRAANDLRAVADRVARETPHRTFAYWLATTSDALERAAT